MNDEQLYRKNKHGEFVPVLTTHNYDRLLPPGLYVVEIKSHSTGWTSINSNAAGVESINSDPMLLALLATMSSLETMVATEIIMSQRPKSISATTEDGVRYLTDAEMQTVKAVEKALGCSISTMNYPSAHEAANQVMSALGKQLQHLLEIPAIKKSYKDLESLCHLTYSNENTQS